MNIFSISISNSLYHFPGNRIENATTSTMNIARVTAIDVFGTESINIAITLHSDKGQCRTSQFETYTDGKYYSPNHTRIVDGDLLKECYEHYINPKNVSVQVSNIDGNDLSIGKIILFKCIIE